MAGAREGHSIGTAWYVCQLAFSLYIAQVAPKNQSIREATVNFS